MKNLESEIYNPESKGFTLIETIVTLVVLSIAIVGVLSVFNVGISNSANPLLVDQATQLAQGELNHVIGMKMNSAAGFASVVVSQPSCSTPMPTGFSCRRSVCLAAAGNPIVCGALPDYKRVEVGITMSTGATVSAVTLLTNY